MKMINWISSNWWFTFIVSFFFGLMIGDVCYNIRQACKAIVKWVNILEMDRRED